MRRGCLVSDGGHPISERGDLESRGESSSMRRGCLVSDGGRPVSHLPRSVSSLRSPQRWTDCGPCPCCFVHCCLPTLAGR